jgi:hypothetical protein
VPNKEGLVCARAERPSPFQVNWGKTISLWVRSSGGSVLIARLPPVSPIFSILSLAITREVISTAELCLREIEAFLVWPISFIESRLYNAWRL